jgi:hypothetical protein
VFHHVTMDEITPHLGMVLTFEMEDGSMVTGRLLGWEHERIFLGRTTHEEIALHNVKRVNEARLR